MVAAGGWPSREILTVRIFFWAADRFKFGVEPIGGTPLNIRH